MPTRARGSRPPTWSLPGHGLIAEDGAVLAEKRALYRRAGRQRGGRSAGSPPSGRRLTTFPAAVREGYLEQHLLPLPMRDAAHPDGAAAPFMSSPEERDGCCEQVLQIQSRGLAAAPPTRARRPPSWASRAGSIRRSPCSRRCARPICIGRAARQRAGGDNARLWHDRAHEGQRANSSANGSA